MTKLVRVQVENLTVEQLQWLQKYARDAWDKADFRDILRQAREQLLALWELEDSPAKGIVGTKIFEGKRGRMLWLEFLVGEGLLADAIAIRLAIHEVRKLAECSSLEGIVSRPGLARLYERVLGVKPSAQIFREEF